MRKYLEIDKPWKLWRYLQGLETSADFMSIVSRSMQFAKIKLPLHCDIWCFFVLWLSFRVLVYVSGSLCTSLLKCISLSLSVQVCLVCSLTVLASSCLPAWMAVCLSYIYIYILYSPRSHCYWQLPGSVFHHPTPWTLRSSSPTYVWASGSADNSAGTTL